MKVYKYKDKTVKLSDLQEAYNKVSEIECQEKKELEYKRDQKYKQVKETGKKPDDWDRLDDDRYKKYYDNIERDNRMREAIKEKAEKIKESDKINLDEMFKRHSENDKRRQHLLSQYEKQQKEQEFFMGKITDGNKYQLTFFQIIDNYLVELKDDTERGEALTNIIKYCIKIKKK